MASTKIKDKIGRNKCFTCVLWIIEKTFHRVPRKMMEVGNEKERFTRSNCKKGDKPLSRGKNESSSGI